VNFNLSEEQEMLKKMARDFLTEKCPKTFVKEMEARGMKTSTCADYLA